MERQSHALLDLDADGVRAGGLVHVRLGLEVRGRGGREVGAADELVAVTDREEGGVDRVLPPREEGDELHPISSVALWPLSVLYFSL